MKLNQKGITLVEVILVLALLSIIIASAYSVINLGMKGYERETVTVDNQFNIRYALSYIGREIRKAELVEVSSNRLRLTDSGGTIVEYQLDGDIIKEDLRTLVIGIKTFTVSTDGDKVDLLVESEDNSAGNSFELSSQIIIRK